MSFSEQVLTLCKLRCSDTIAQVNFCVVVKPDFSWLATYCESTVETDKCTVLSHIPAILDSGAVFDFANVCLTIVDKLQGLLKLLDEVQPCCGNSDEKF